MRMTSNSASRQARIASAPSAASTTSKPSWCNSSRRSARISASSSTTSTLPSWAMCSLLPFPEPLSLPGVTSPPPPPAGFRASSAAAGASAVGLARSVGHTEERQAPTAQLVAVTALTLAAPQPRIGRLRVQDPFPGLRRSQLGQLVGEPLVVSVHEQQERVVGDPLPEAIDLLDGIAGEPESEAARLGVRYSGVRGGRSSPQVNAGSMTTDLGMPGALSRSSRRRSASPPPTV